jgi:hypothetical protein
MARRSSLRREKSTPQRAAMLGSKSSGVSGLVSRKGVRKNKTRDPLRESRDLIQPVWQIGTPVSRKNCRRREAC